MYIAQQTADGAYQIVDQNGVIYFRVGNAAAPTYSHAVAASATVQTAQSGSGSYAPGNVLHTTGGTGTNPVEATFTVTHTKVITAVVNAAGSGGTPGAATFTGTTGTGTKFQCTGTIEAGGTLTGALVVSVAGDYTVNPTSLAAEPVTGGSLTGATITLKTGVLTAALLTAGSIDHVHANPITTTVTPTGGTGATLNVTWTYTSQGAETAGYMAFPTHTPASATAAGVIGSVAWDASYIYVCVAQDSWKRVAISAW